jgi:hypothetical protein
MRKRSEHRNLRKQFHHFTANAIAAALLEVQRDGIAVIPHESKPKELFDHIP